jgi:hypothetical protein
LYEIRQVDDVSVFLGVKFLWERSDDGDLKSVALSQPRYIEDVLRRFGLTECKLAITLMVEAFFVGLDEEEDKRVVDVELYQQIIGSLLYLALRTRPDTLAAVSILARFSQSPTTYCHRGVKRVLRYFRGPTNMSLLYCTGKSVLMLTWTPTMLVIRLIANQRLDMSSNLVMQCVFGDRKSR